MTHAVSLVVLGVRRPLAPQYQQDIKSPIKTKASIAVGASFINRRLSAQHSTTLTARPPWEVSMVLGWHIQADLAHGFDHVVGLFKLISHHNASCISVLSLK